MAENAGETSATDGPVHRIVDEDMSFSETQQWVVPVTAPDDPVLQTCTRCVPERVVVWNETALCCECFLAASIQMATGRSDLYLTLRTLPPRAADHVIRAILRQISASQARGWHDRNSSDSERWRNSTERTGTPYTSAREV